MSASNWRQCPRCVRFAELSKGRKVDALSQQYGKISEEQYNAELSALDQPIVLSDTLREDIRGPAVFLDGQFCVSYSCECSKCGFTFAFKHEEKVDIVKKPKKN